MLKLILSILKVFLNKKQQPSTPPKIEIANPNDVLVHEAQNWIGVVEVGGDNSGPDVERFQKAVDGKANKEAWCAAFVIFCIQQVETKLNIKSQIYRSELAQDLWFKSPNSLKITEPEPGCVIIWKHGDTVLGHAGIVEIVRPDGMLVTIEGNTNDGAGIVREGDGVYRRVRTPTGTPKMKVLGFIKPFA